MSATLRRAFCTMLFALIVLWAVPATAQSLEVRVDGDHLRIAVGNSRFVAGDSLMRLRDGAAVTFFVRVSTLTGKAGKILSSTEYRFVVSFDIFEEKFQVTRTMPSAKVSSHLSMTAAEAACNDGLELSITGVAPSMPFWIRWE